MAKGTAKPVSQSLANLEKELKALRLQVRQVENGLSLNKVINVSILVGLCWGLALGAEGFYQGRRAYQALTERLPFLGENQADQGTAPAELDLTPVKRGDKVAGLTVTSVFREPQRPNHNGVDVGGPVGTPYFAPATVTVRCYWDRSGGGYVAEFQYRDLLWQLLHLKAGTCKNGTQAPGVKIGEMGNTGRSTGPHLHLQLRNPDRTFIEPKRGHLLAVLQPPAPRAGAPGEPIPDDLLKRAIGRAEGTRDSSGQPTQSYYGHPDPGWAGRCQNQGSFSYQHCAASPEAADASWLGTLRKAEQDINAQAQAKFGQPLSQAAMVAALDGYTQSPNAGGMFVDHLPTADPNPQQIIAARTAALEASRRAKGGPPMNVPRDQQRRVNAVLEQVNR